MPASGGASSLRVDTVTELYAFGGIHIATSQATVEMSPHSYLVITDVKSSGLADLFIALKTHSEARGLIVGDQLQPRFYSGEVHRNGSDSYSRVDHHSDGRMTATTEPATASFDGDRTLIGGSIDQLTAFLTIERKVAQGSSCSDDIRVFDGRHLYILHFRDAAAASTSPLRACSMQRQAVAGFADGDGHGEGVSQAVLYYAVLTGQAIAVPLRVELWTEFGPVTGRLSTLRVNGVEWHLSR